jgi:hypothetical protein
VTYALTRLAVEYARDKQETLRDLRRYTSDGNKKPSLISSYVRSSKESQIYPAPAPGPSSRQSEDEK